VTKQSRPPLDPDAARELVEPSARDRERIRENLDRALARGSASPTVLRVDASMAQRAIGGAPAALYGSKAALAKLVIPAVLIGAGVGAILARNLFAPQTHVEPSASHSLPVQVEDLEDDDLPAPYGFAGQSYTPEPLVFEASPPTAATTSAKSSQHAKVAHRGQAHSGDARLVPHAPAAASEPAPGVAAAE